MLQSLSREDRTVDTLEVLNSGIEQLREEHISLKHQMSDFCTTAKALGQDPAVIDWRDEVRGLREAVKLFMGEMEQHSVWEDEVLFPKVQEYTGRDMGPVAVMEHEHELAKMNVERFLEKTGADAPLSGEQAKEAASYLLQAYVILTDHFAKEEEVLFPLAEQMLTDIEQFFSN